MDKRPNILWIFSDEHRAQAMSCRGDQNVETTYMDLLAKNGCRYDRAYSTAPLCAPFRACLMTGKYLNEHGVVSLHVPLLNQKLISETMQEYGYRTAYYGKWHLSGGAAPSHFVSKYFCKGFDEFVGWENSNRFFDTHYFKDTDENPQAYRVMEKYQTDALTDLVIEGIQKNLKQEKPWFQIVSYEAPHPPAVGNQDLEEYCRAYAPKEYLDQYQERNIVLRPNVVGNEKERERIKTLHKAYYAAIKNLDDNIGRIYEYLKQKGELENTIIFYFSDHGDFWGSHGRYGKCRAEEESSNIPMIIHWPNGICGGQVKTELFSGVDIFPTLCGLLNVPIPSYCSGMDLSYQMTEGEGRSRKTVLIQGERTFYASAPEKERYRALVTDEYKYIYYQQGGKEALFHIETDPYEMKNLVGQNEYKEVCRNLNKQLIQQLRGINDNFAEQF